MTTTKKKSAKKPAKKQAKKKTAAKKKAIKKTAKASKKSTAKKKAVKSGVKKSAKKSVSKKVSKKTPARLDEPKPLSKSAAKKSRLQRKKAVEKTKRLIEEARQKAAPKIKKYKPNKKTRYTKTELEHFRKIILEERNKIIESAKANMQALVDEESSEYVGDNLTYASHMAEQGSDEMEREKNYMFVQRDEKYLGYLQEALTRIDQGTYGVCIDCFETPHNLCKTCPLIDKERLELVPITQHCIECKNIRG